MSTAAARAAAERAAAEREAAAALARRLDNIRSTADKQLDHMQRAVEPLAKSSYYLFMKQLRRQALSFGWPSHILSDSDADLTDAERNALDEDTVEGLKAILHIRNAFVTITSKCDGHQVEGLLETCPDSRARMAVDIIREYFHPKSTAGRRLAYSTFVNASMANTHTTLIEWVALVRRHAINLRQVGGQADDDAELSVILNGLLPEFKDVKLILDQTENLSLMEAVRKLTNHARTNNLLNVAKGKGNASRPDAKVFSSVAVAAGCAQWLSKEAMGNTASLPTLTRKASSRE